MERYLHYGWNQLEAAHSLVTKQLEGRKKDKERITIVVCCNGDGSDKVPLWVIDMYANPRCFKMWTWAILVATIGQTKEGGWLVYFFKNLLVGLTREWMVERFNL